MTWKDKVDGFSRGHLHFLLCWRNFSLKSEKFQFRVNGREIEVSGATDPEYIFVSKL
jgi:hypothetical protein